MYGGKVLETGTVYELFAAPHQPYTQGLLNSIPRPDRQRKDPLSPIPGSPPDMLHTPAGCPFMQRCTQVRERCLREMPPLLSVQGSATHFAACWATNAPGTAAFEDGRTA